MNTPNPLVPQGTTPPGGKILRNAVFTILVLHVALIGGFLIGGCKPPPVDTTSSEPTNGYALGTNEAVVPPMDTNNNFAVATTSNGVNAVDYSAPTPAVIPAPVTAGTTEYTIAKGDQLGIVAKKHGVSLKALLDANPGIDPKKLKVGAKVQIPAPTAPVASSDSAVAPAADATSSEAKVYAVKSGDSLAKIAKSHGTTVAAIVSLNHLKSKNAIIKQGQKLKMPAPKAAVAAHVPVAESSVAGSAAPASSSPVSVAQ